MFSISDLPDSIQHKIRVDPSGCWVWIAGRYRDGYGQYRSQRAHRVIWEIAQGRTFPVGLVSDHICHDPDTCVSGTTCPHRACVNPAHIRVATVRENSSAQRSAHPRSTTHCLNGHELTYDNMYVSAYEGQVRRRCRTCAIASATKRSKRVRAKTYAYKYEPY